MVWTGELISRLNDSETQERGLWGVKIQKFPGGACPQTSLEVGNRSVFILDPQLDFYLNQKTVKL